MPTVLIDRVTRREVGNRTYYFGSMTSDTAKSITFVPVLENSPKTPLVENTENGYQRPGSQARMGKFRNFLVDNPNSVVPPVLLSGRGHWKFKSTPEYPDYGVLEIEGSAAILDGQHRLGGYVMLYESSSDVRSIDFVALEGLSLEEEVKEFITVNNTQVGVPKSLSSFLGIGIDDEQADDAWVAWQLNIREDSPIQGRITRTKMGPEHLFQLHSVTKNVERMFKSGAFSDTDRDERADIAIRFWNIVADSHPTQWGDIEKLGVQGLGRKAFLYKILELTGFIAWSLIAKSRILALSYNSSSHTVDWDRVERMVIQLSDRIDWLKTGEFQGLTGEVGGKKICDDMERILSEDPT